MPSIHASELPADALLDRTRFWLMSAPIEVNGAPVTRLYLPASLRCVI